MFIGDIIDDVEVISFEYKDNNYVKHYKVRCKVCGHEKILTSSALKLHRQTKHNNRTCKYLQNYDDKIGLIVNDYKIIKRLDKKYKSVPYYLAKCMVCGCEYETTIGNFKRFGNKHENCTTHLSNNKYLNRFRKIYSCMRYRTTNPKSDKYKFYGGIGISSEYYSDFIVFYNELFESYKKHVDKYGEKNTTLDRIDPKGNYEKGNVRWATVLEQANNKRSNVYYIINGQKKSLSEWCRYFKRDYSVVINRINNLHWGFYEALEIDEKQIV